MKQLFNDLYLYRELLKNNVKKEVRGKYKGTWLGIIWSFLNPLLMLVVYSLIFPYILRVNVENYTMYLMVALIPWTFFTVTTQIGAGSIVSNAGILKKVYFPREIIPISVVTSGTINYIISSIITIVFLIFSGVGISTTILFFPVLLIIQYIFLLGLTFIFSSVTVYIRDLEHLISIALMVLFYATPIVYTADTLPEKFKWILTINPMAYIIAGYRDILYYQKLPALSDMLIISLVAVVTLLAGFTIFKKLEKNFVEEL